MAAKQRGLARGLDALFGDNVKPAEPEQKKQIAEPVADAAGGEIYIKTSLIVPNKTQPRKIFEKEALNELAESIKTYGILQPLLVKKSGSNYEIIAGERRWRAAQLAGIKELPVLVRDYDEKLRAEVSIIENLQREDLNPIEEAGAYAQLMEDFGLTQEEVAERVSKNRTTITNMLRLLKLDNSVQQMLVDGRLSQGHARALLSLEDKDVQKTLAEKIAEEKLSVREVEKLVKKSGKSKTVKPQDTKSEEPDRNYDVFYEEYENVMKGILGTKVRISRKDNNKGRIEIEYYSQPELERIMELLRSINE